MPLLKKKPHKLLEPPKNLQPQELVYQVRFTKEIFRDYQMYLKRINMYRQRVWTCKSTGKTSLTYEEALESEKLASKKVQTLPRELVAPALHIIQFSTLSLKDLADTIATELQNCFFAGAELYGNRDGEFHPCRILNVVTDGDSEPQYEVGFLDKDKEINENAVLSGEDLSWKKFPFSRNFLKSFIRESTCHSIPWVVNEYLAKAHGITRKIPKELQDKYVFQNGELVQQRKQEDKTGKEKGKRKRAEEGSHVAEETEVNDSKEEPINYPIEDLLLPLEPDDANITQRPSPSRDFSVPMDCVGDLLMVWDFCSSFGRQLHLWRFSLEDFENAVCHKESNLVLIMEVHACLFRFLINEGDDTFKALKRRSRKSKITLITWTEYLCDFLDSVDIPDLCCDIGTIKRGHYGLLDPNVKLKILSELVNQIAETMLFKGEVDELLEQRHALGAARREEALAEAKQKRKEKERSKAGEEAEVLANSKLVKKKNSPQVQESSEDSKMKESSEGKIKMENGSVSSGKPEKSEKRLMGNVYLRRHKKQMTDTKSTSKEKVEEEEEEAESEDGEEEEEEEKARPGKKQGGKSSSEDEKGTLEMRGPEQRRQYYEREMEKIVIRTNPLGKDRNYNRYWWFRSNGRIFVEDSDCKEWGYYTSKEELDALMASLNRKGERELSLHTQLEKFYDRICSTLQKRAKDIAHNIEMEEAVVRRSTRVKAPLHENPASAFQRYVNKWKED